MKNEKILSVAALIAASLSAAHAQFTAGDLAVLQVGTGSAALSSAGTALFIDQFNTSTVGQTVSPFLSIPTDGTGLVTSGSATSEGALTLSTDGTYLTFGGYAAAAGTTGVANGTAPREAGNISAGGVFSVAANTSAALSGNNIRSVVSSGNNNWLAGPTGVYYQSSGSSSLTTVQTALNARVDNIVNGSLYFSVGSGSTRGIYAFSGNPTAASTPTLLFNTGSSSSPYDFALNAAGTVAYVADDRSAASSGGIEKWTFDGSAWTLAYTLALGTTSAGGARELTVDWSGANPIIYATTTEASANRLVDVVDTGSSATYTTLATAPANTAFRGVDFAPTAAPEPATLALAGLGGLMALVAVRRR